MQDRKIMRVLQDLVFLCGQLSQVSGTVDFAISVFSIRGGRKLHIFWNTARSQASIAGDNGIKSNGEF